MLNVQINLYTIDELEKEAREKAIDEHAIFLIDALIVSTDELPNDDYILDIIRANEYYFFKDGTFAQVVEYCGGHPREGETDIIIHGETYTDSGSK